MGAFLEARRNSGGAKRKEEARGTTRESRTGRMGGCGICRNNQK